MAGAFAKYFKKGVILFDCASLIRIRDLFVYSDIKHEVSGIGYSNTGSVVMLDHKHVIHGTAYESDPSEFYIEYHTHPFYGKGFYFPSSSDLASTISQYRMGTALSLVVAPEGVYFIWLNPEIQHIAISTGYTTDTEPPDCIISKLAQAISKYGDKTKKPRGRGRYTNSEEWAATVSNFTVCDYLETSEWEDLTLCPASIKIFTIHFLNWDYIEAFDKIPLCPDPFEEWIPPNNNFKGPCSLGYVRGVIKDSERFKRTRNGKFKQ